MAGRALAFSDPAIVRMATRDYVPVTSDDWYERRRDDPEGTFFRHVADQGPHKGEGGATRQGIYCLTADGQLLAYKNAGQAPDVMREVLRDALAAWARLPASRRRPGAVHVAAAPRVDRRYDRQPPPGGAVVDVYTRILDDDGHGGLCQGTCEFQGGDKAARDHLWLTAAECQGLVPARAAAGDRFPLPAAIARRIACFHLIDNTRGEPPMWEPEQVRSSRMELTVEEADARRVRLRLDGRVLLATDADPARASRGFDARLLGYLTYDRTQGRLVRFDVVALGDHWGEGTFTRNARPGRKPLGVAFELADPKKPADRVPPQAARELGRYFGVER